MLSTNINKNYRLGKKFPKLGYHGIPHDLPLPCPDSFPHPWWTMSPLYDYLSHQLFILSSACPHPKQHKTKTPDMQALPGSWPWMPFWGGKGIQIMHVQYLNSTLTLFTQLHSILDIRVLHRSTSHRGSAPLYYMCTHHSIKYTFLKKL